MTRLFRDIGFMLVVCRQLLLNLVGNTRPQGLMWTAGIVMAHPFSKRALQMRFIQRYQIIQTLSTDGSDQSLAKSIRRWRMRR